MDELTPIERSWMEGLRAPPAPACLEADAMIELAERGRRAHDYDSRMKHIAVCPVCRSTLKLLRQTEAIRPRARLVPEWMTVRIFVAVGAAAALVIAWFGFHGSTGLNRSAPNVAVHQVAPNHEQPGPIAPSAKGPPTTVADDGSHESERPLVPRRRPTRLAMRHRPRRPSHREGVPLIGANTDAHGTLEGTVGDAEILEGQVDLGGGVVVGEVRPPKS